MAKITRSEALELSGGNATKIINHPTEESWIEEHNTENGKVYLLIDTSGCDKGLVGIYDTIKEAKEALKNYKPTVDDVFSGVPDEFTKIPLNLIIDGCLDRLGTFNKKHITRAFILKQGIWLTPSESRDLIENDENGNVRDRLEVIRERLNIKEVEKLYINSRGLSYTQMRAMLNIKPNKKYMDLTTVQLETLRYRILFNLEETVKDHITSWERRMEEIEMVAEAKGYRL